ncbi:unnamed protein product [Tenebrio molitor]|nr:unnamed protein product [Tenebrio molitor]
MYSPTEILVEFGFGCKFMFVIQAGMLQVVVVVFMTTVIT